MIRLPSFRTSLQMLLASAALLIFTFSAFAQRKEPTLRWTFKARGILVAAPVTDGRHVFIGSYDSSFYGLDPATGKADWKYKTNGPIGSTACLGDGKIYFFSGDGALYCLNALTGKRLWSFKTLSGALPDRRYDWPDYYQSSPVLDNGFVYFGGGDGRIYAVNAATGALKWSFATGDVVHTRPALANGKVVAGSFDGGLYCINQETGAMIWRFKTTGHRYFPRGEINGNPLIHNGKIFFGARDYNLYAVDLESGYCHWLRSFQKGWALSVTPNDSVIYVGTSDDRLLLALDEETGNARWERNLGFNIFGGMAIDGQSGYIGTLMGKLFCVDLRTGGIEWTFRTDGYKKYAGKYFQEDDRFFVANIGALLPNGNAMLKMYEQLGAVFSQPLELGGKILFASNDGTLYCLE